jgi:hypothetical protein
VQHAQVGKDGEAHRLAWAVVEGDLLEGGCGRGDGSFDAEVVAVAADGNADKPAMRTRTTRVAAALPSQSDAEPVSKLREISRLVAGLPAGRPVLG